MKKYILTKEERDEVLDYMKMRSTLAARNLLLQLPELSDKIWEEKIKRIINNWWKVKETEKDPITKKDIDELEERLIK